MKTKNTIKTLAAALAVLLCVAAAKAQTSVADFAAFDAALQSMQGTGGTIDVTGNLAVTANGSKIYKVASTAGNAITINMGANKFTINNGSGGDTLEIGANVVINCTATLLTANNNANKDVIKITGGEINATVGNAHVINAQYSAGLIMTGGAITHDNAGGTGNQAVISCDGMVAAISGGTISSNLPGARVLRINNATLKVTGNPSISATGNNGWAVMSQNGGKVTIDGSPTIAATGASGGKAIVAQVTSGSNQTHAIILRTATPTITGDLSSSTTGGTLVSLIDLRGLSVVATPASGTELPMGGQDVNIAFSNDAMLGSGIMGTGSAGAARLRYTTDGSTPTATSEPYYGSGGGSISVTEAKTIKVRIWGAGDFLDDEIYTFTYTIAEPPSSSVEVSSATELLAAIATLQTEGGDIVLKNSIDTAPGEGNTYALASAGRKVNINTGSFSIKITGPGTMLIGDSVNIFGSATVLTNAEGGVIRVTGGEISTSTAGSNRAIDANGGNLFVSGGKITASSPASSGNSSAINIDNGYTAEISGGIITSTTTNARTIRVSSTNQIFGVLKISGSPTITAEGEGAHAIIAQHGGKVLLDGSPLIHANGANGSCVSLNVDGANPSSFLIVMRTATPELGGGANPGDTVRIGNGACSFIDFRETSVEASQLSGSVFTAPTNVAFTIAGLKEVKSAAAPDVAKIFYTADDSNPTTASESLASGGSLVVGATATYKLAVGVAEYYADASNVQAFSYTVNIPVPVYHTVTVEVRDSSSNLITSPAFSVAMTGDTAGNKATVSGATSFTVLASSNLSFTASANGYEITPNSIALSSLSNDTTVVFTARPIAVVEPVTHTVTVEVRNSEGGALMASPSFAVSATGGFSGNTATVSGVATFTDVPTEIQLTLSASAEGYTLTPASHNIASLTSDTTLVFTASQNAVTSVGMDKSSTLSAYIAHDVLYVSDEVKAVKLVNLQGSVVLLQANVIKSVNMTHLPSGIYFAVLQGEGGVTRTVKVVK